MLTSCFKGKLFETSSWSGSLQDNCAGLASLAFPLEFGGMEQSPLCYDPAIVSARELSNTVLALPCRVQ